MGSLHRNYPETSERLTQEVIDGSSTALQQGFRRFRKIVLERAGKSEYTSKEGDGSPVTDTDTEIEEALQADLALQYPDVPVFGEESGYDDNNLPPACWLIDPIDGTKSFIENVPTFTGMAVLIEHGEAIAAIIYNTSTDDMYTAQKGKGAFKNGTRIDLAAVPLPPIAFCKTAFIEDISAILAPKKVVGESAPNGGGFGFTMVLDGLAAARFQLHGGGYTHDYAPGGLLVGEAGGALVPILDDEYTFKTRSFVACHPELETVIRSHIPRLRELELAKKK
jgi:myo-inositol-1(or 4)-monophosphatase